MRIGNHNRKLLDTEVVSDLSTVTVFSFLAVYCIEHNTVQEGASRVYYRDGGAVIDAVKSISKVGPFSSSEYNVHFRGVFGHPSKRYDFPEGDAVDCARAQPLPSLFYNFERQCVGQQPPSNGARAGGDSIKDSMNGF